MNYAVSTSVERQYDARPGRLTNTSPDGPSETDARLDNMHISTLVSINTSINVPGTY